VNEEPTGGCRAKRKKTKCRTDTRFNKEYFNSFKSGQTFPYAIKIYRNSFKYMWECQRVETRGKEMKVKELYKLAEGEVNERGL
jgi:hypothetical protein